MFRTLVGVVVFVAVLFTIRTGDACPPQLLAGGECPPGCYVLGKNCTACAPTFYNAKKDQTDSCVSCDNCSRHEKEVEPCTKISNRNCSCVDGYRWNKHHDGCVRIPTTPTSDRPTIQGITTTTTTTPAPSTSCPTPSLATRPPAERCDCKECEKQCGPTPSLATRSPAERCDCKECEKQCGARPPEMNVGFAKLMYFRDTAHQQALQCRATGIPAVNFEWEFNGQKLQNTPREVEITTDGKLTLLRPTINNVGLYQCFAFNQHGKAMSPPVDMKKAELNGFPTLSQDITGMITGPFDEGRHVVLNCRGQPHSAPAATYDWYKGKAAVVYGKRIVIDQAGSLHFINVERGDELSGDLTYNCSLYNDLSASRVYGSPSKFAVNPAQGAIPQRRPEIYWFTDPGNAVALLGKSITIQCIPDGYPLPTIEWSKKGGSLPAGRHVIDDLDYTLTITGVQEEDEQTYICAAVHGDQRTEQSIFVDVKSEPIWVHKLKSVTVANGDTAHFRCEARSAQGENDTVQLEWLKNAVPLNGSSENISISDTELTVTGALKPYHLMNIQCRVTNSIGSQLADAYLNVIEQTKLSVRPEERHLLDPGNTTRIRIVAEADPLYANQLAYKWSKEGIPIGTNSREPVYVDVTNALIINATEFGGNEDFLTLLGNYTCLVTMGLENGVGDIVVSTYVASEHEDEILTASQPDLWWIAIIIAVIVLIPTIILVCCLWYRNRGGTNEVAEKDNPEQELADLSRASSHQAAMMKATDTDSSDGYGEADSNSTRMVHL